MISYLNFPRCKVENFKSVYHQRWPGSSEWKTLLTHCSWSGQKLVLQVIIYRHSGLTSQQSLLWGSVSLPQSKSRAPTPLPVKRCLPPTSAKPAWAPLTCTLGGTKCKAVKGNAETHHSLHMQSKQSFKILLINNLDQKRASRAKESHTKYGSWKLRVLTVPYRFCTEIPAHLLLYP